jgi:hypothetical protein
LISLEEVETTEEGNTAKNSLSLTRAPGGKDDGLKGSSTNFPFWPGGFDAVVPAQTPSLASSAPSDENKEDGVVQVDATEAELFDKLFTKG